MKRIASCKMEGGDLFFTLETHKKDTSLFGLMSQNVVDPLEDSRTVAPLHRLFQLIFASIRSLSATMAINSLLVGFALVLEMVYPNRLEMESRFPRDHATSMA